MVKKRVTNHEVFVLRIIFAYKDNIICERFANNAEEKARKKARMRNY